MTKISQCGSVWRLSFVRVEPGRGDEYLNHTLPLRKKLMDQAIKDGVVISHKVMTGLCFGENDWDFMFMVEYKNWSSIDGIKAKLDALNEAIVGPEENVMDLVRDREKVRTIVGEKFMQEIICE
jgi:hypothetical protein